jgi:LuxR family maltose regulon positive regulatory protein
VSTWVSTRGEPVAWLSLDAADNDPIRFWRYIDAALQTVDSGLGESLRAALFSSQPPATEQIITGLVNDISALNRKLILVFEDYPVIENADVHAGMNFLLDNLPPAMHIIITTRSDPPLRLGLRRGRRQIKTEKETNHDQHLSKTKWNEHCRAGRQDHPFHAAIFGCCHISPQIFAQGCSIA